MDGKSCMNCEHCGTHLAGGIKRDTVCRLKPGVAVAAFVPGVAGLEVKVATAWPPVSESDWCGEFKAKLQ